MKHQPVRQGQTTTLGTMWILQHPLLTNDDATLKMQETGPPVYSPYLRLEHLTICRDNVIAKAAHSPPNFIYFNTENN